MSVLWGPEYFFRLPHNPLDEIYNFSHGRSSFPSERNSWMENCLPETKSTGGVSCLAWLVWLTRLKCCQYSMGQQENSVHSVLTGRTLHYTGDAKKRGWVPYHPKALWSSNSFNPFLNLSYSFKKRRLLCSRTEVPPTVTNWHLQ